MMKLTQRLEEVRTALSPSFDIVYRHVDSEYTGMADIPFLPF